MTRDRNRIPGPASLARGAPAFTLVQLLTVIAIIGVLSAILIPVIGRARQSARDALCASNIRQWGMASQLYVADHHGRFPQTAWDTNGHYAQYDLLPYLLPNAPADHTKQMALIRQNFNCTADGWKYGFNSYLSEQPASTVTEPSRLILATCSTAGWLDASAMNGTKDYLKVTPKPHSGKVHVVYVDGSVRSAAVSTLTYADARRGTSSYKPGDDTTHFLGGDPQYDK